MMGRNDETGNARGEHYQRDGEIEDGTGLEHREGPVWKERFEKSCQESVDPEEKSVWRW